VSRKLRAGLVGLGMMGRHHARVLSSLKDVELVAVCDPMGDPHKAGWKSHSFKNS
jgi:predicted dehydrogenase